MVLSCSCSSAVSLQPGWICVEDNHKRDLLEALCNLSNCRGQNQPLRDELSLPK